MGRGGGGGRQKVKNFFFGKANQRKTKKTKIWLKKNNTFGREKNNRYKIRLLR